MARVGAGVLVGIALGGVALVALRPRKRGSSRVRPSSGNAPGGGWADAAAPARIRALARPIERATGWSGLGDFLVAKAWTESRGNASAGSGAKTNEARGWFGIRPTSGLAHALSQYADSHPNLLKDERWAVAVAAWYAVRLRAYAADGQTLDWLAIARGWALPSLVSDVHNTNDRSKDTARRFEQAVYQAGLDPLRFPHVPAFPNGFSWPGIGNALQLVDARSPNTVHIAGRRRNA